MIASQAATSQGFWHLLWSTPSPWVGGIVAGLITGGFFGWIAYLRNIRPTLIFYRVQEGKDRVWQAKNVGQGVAAYVRIHDYNADKRTITKKVRTYPIGPNDPPRKLVWLTDGGKLEALYTDVYGRRWYQTICDENENRFSRIHRSFWRRPNISELRKYEKEIDAVLKYQQRNSK
jgi:hypothetical protein